MTYEKGNMIEFYKKQALVYSRKKIPVHISKDDGIFYNGIIIEVGSNFFFIDDLKEGRQLVFFSQLKQEVVEYKEKKEEGENGTN